MLHHSLPHYRSSAMFALIPLIQEKYIIFSNNFRSKSAPHGLLIDITRIRLIFRHVTSYLRAQPKRVSCYGDYFQQRGNDQWKCQLKNDICIEKLWEKTWSNLDGAFHPTKLIFLFEEFKLFDRFLGLLILSVNLWITFHPPPPPHHSLFLY